jgi:2-polyprenyl-3-methyl-5-hydroxy-6-metoxy-1,4-benzoquinol methylase
MDEVTTTTLEHLEKIAENSLYSKGIMVQSIEYCFKVMSRYAKFNDVLELGPAEGVMTRLLAENSTNLTLVEGSYLFCESLRENYRSATVIHSLFETYEPSCKFDTIVLSHVLEHVDNPVGLLSRLTDCLKPDGIVFCAVPNAMSIHRQTAVIMGILETETALNELDHHHGHKRVYYPELLRSHFRKSGLTIESFGGYWLKSFSNGQLEIISDEQITDGFMQLGEQYPDIAGEIYVVAKKTT